MKLASVLLVLPALAYGIVLPNPVERSAATPTPKPPHPPHPPGGQKTWVVDVWPGSGCAAGAATSGPAQAIKGSATGGSGCLTNAVTYGSANIKNAAGCTITFYDDAQCTVVNALQSTAVGKCVSFTPGTVVTMGVSCP